MPGPQDERGFTLVEIMVALGLLVVVLMAALPAFLGLLGSTVTTKMETQGKNVTQERLEQMRDLRYHVDRQNGPFLDVLDVYYTNAKSSGVTTSVPASGMTLSGHFVATGPAAGGLPAAPFYKTTTGPLPAATAFSQIVTAQFLGPDGAPVPLSRLADIYDSQVVGKDQAPSLMLGVTVLTSWSDRGRAKSYRAYTRITDGRPQLPVIQSQARATAIDITSTAVDGTTLDLQGGIASADGAQSSGSSVSGYAGGALATRTGLAPASGAVTQFSLPATSASGTGSGGPMDPGECSWYGFGSTGTSNATGDVSVGLPLVPSNAAAATPPNMMSGYINKNGSGTCGQLSFDNTVSGGTPRPTSDPLGYEMGDGPYVVVPDVTTGSGPSISGSVYVLSNALAAGSQKTQSGAAASMAQQIVVFPRSPETGGQGLVQATLTSASVDCISGTDTTDGTVTGRYDLTLRWWGKDGPAGTARWHTARWTYNSAAGSLPVAASGSDTWSPATTYLSNGVTLDQLVTLALNPSGYVTAAIDTGTTNGLRGFANGILSLSSASTLTNEPTPGYSAIRVRLGQLTCVADDQR